MRISAWLTSRRMAYAWITGALLWGLWLLSVALGPGLVDLAGQPVGTDFLQFYAGGRSLLLGDSARLYDVSYQSALQQAIIGPELRTYHAFITPPFFAWLCVPFVLLPYQLGYALWVLLALAMLGAALALLKNSWLDRQAALVFTWFPVFAAVSFGQNSLLSLLILVLTWRLWRRGRGLAAGLVLSLVMYKPQLALGVAFLWLLRWRRDWRALVGLGLGSGLLAGLCFLFLPEASWAYVDFVLHVMPDLPAWQQFPLYHLHTVRGFWRMLLPGVPALADGLAAAVAVLGLGGFWALQRRLRERADLLYALAVCLTIWVTPHAMIYDWAILVLPALLLWAELPALRDQLRGAYALLWVAALVSGPLTLAQQRLLPFAVQVSVIVYVALTVWMAGRLSEGMHTLAEIAAHLPEG